MPDITPVAAKEFLADFIDVSTIPDDKTALELHGKFSQAITKHTSDWRSQLPDELKVAPALKDTKDLPSLAKQFVDLQSHLGASIRIPGQDAGEQDWAAFNKKLLEKVPGLVNLPKDDKPESWAPIFAKLGRPEKPEEYEIPVPEGQAELKEFRAWAHEIGLTKTQAKALASKWNDYSGNIMGQNTQAHQAGIAALDAEWGAAKAGKMASILTLADRTGAPKELVEMAKNGALGANTLKWLDGLVSAIGREGSNLVNVQGAPKNQPTPSEAEMQIAEIMRRPEYWDASSPQSKGLRDKVLELSKQASPGASTDAPPRAGIMGTI